MLVVEQSLTVFLPERASQFLPFTAGNGLLPLQPDADAPDVVTASLTLQENVLVFGGCTALALALAAILLCRGDTK